METELVNWILREIPTSRSSLIGNGDDCAVVTHDGSSVLIATDMLLDGTHFISEQIEPELIGRKAVAVNFSDIAAMGGCPMSVFISLAIPRSTDQKWLERVLKGARDMSAEFGCGIDGGDTNSWTGKFGINVCVTGKPHWRGPVLRSGALKGDAIMITGQYLGGSLLSGRHATFTPRLAECSWILDRVPIHSMIDISDGLGSDATHLASASGKKFLLDSSTITPLSPDDPRYKSVFCDGEDFELLFTCSSSVADYLQRNFPWPCGLRQIGAVEDGQGVYVRHQAAKSPVRLEFSGYQH